MEKGDASTEFYKIAKNPFAEGGVRYAFRAQRYTPITDDVKKVSISKNSSGKKREEINIDGTLYIVTEEVVKQFKAKSRGDLGLIPLSKDNDRLR